MSGDANTFPRRILQTWKTHDLPPRFAAWRQTWLKYHPDYEHLLWSDEDNRKFVKDNFPEYLDVYDGYQREIERVDAVRYMFMYSKGGIYADLDHEALRPFDTLLDQRKSDDIILGHLEVEASTPQWANHAIPNSLMISKPKCDFWLFVIDEMVRRAKGTPTGDHALLDAVEYKTGPVLLTECVRAYKGDSKITILPTEAFYPINWTRMEPMHQPLRQRIVSEGHHLSHEQAQAMFPHSLTVTYWTHTW